MYVYDIYFCDPENNASTCTPLSYRDSYCARSSPPLCYSIYYSYITARLRVMLLIILVSQHHNVYYNQVGVVGMSAKITNSQTYIV